MSAFITAYDNITSNKYVSVGITTTSLLYSGLRVYSLIEIVNPLMIVITACAGVAFALISKSYLDGIQKIDTNRDKNSLYSTLSMLSVFAPIGYDKPAIFRFTEDSYFQTCFNRVGLGLGVGVGFSLGFTATTLILQLAEGKKTIPKK